MSFVGLGTVGAGAGAEVVHCGAVVHVICEGGWDGGDCRGDKRGYEDLRGLIGEEIGGLVSRAFKHCD